MAGFGGMLSIARGALAASQQAVQIASHNIANANTEGYSRQREVLAAAPPERTAQGVFGMGVELVTVQRQRDALLDQEYRNNSSMSSMYSTRSELLQRVETVFAEPSDTGLASALDKFYNAWSELAADPTNTSARTTVQQTGSSVALTFNSIANQLNSLGAETVERAGTQVDEVNRIAAEIAQLNGKIVSMESGGGTAGDLRDRRDILLDQLGAFASTRVIPQENGSIAVVLGTVSLIDGIYARQLETLNISTIEYRIVGSPDTLRNIGGSLGALQDVHNTDITGVMADLDALAQGIVTSVNALHRTGWTSGLAVNNIDFFDPAMLKAVNMELSAAVSADARTIAAGTTVGATGDNALALQIAGLRDAAPAAGAHGNFGAYYRAIVGDVAGSVNQAKNATSAYGALVDQADQRRTAIFGVSVDEELIQIMRQQQAYAAASKVIKTVDEMLQTLLNLK